MLMDKNELRRLNRMELMELLLEQEQENLSLKEKVEALQKQLDDRTIRLDKAGSIAEASLMLNHMFEAAEASCSQYLDNIRRLSESQEEINARRDAVSQKRAQSRIIEATARCRQMEADTKKKCDELLADTDKRVEEKWGQISQRLNDLYSSHQGLMELVNCSLSLIPKRGDGDEQPEKADH